MCRDPRLFPPLLPASHLCVSDAILPRLSVCLPLRLSGPCLPAAFCPLTSLRRGSPSGPGPTLRADSRACLTESRRAGPGARPPAVACPQEGRGAPRPALPAGHSHHTAARPRPRPQASPVSLGPSHGQARAGLGKQGPALCQRWPEPSLRRKGLPFPGLSLPICDVTSFRPLDHAAPARLTVHVDFGDSRGTWTPHLSRPSLPL